MYIEKLLLRKLCSWGKCNGSGICAGGFVDPPPHLVTITFTMAKLLLASPSPVAELHQLHEVFSWRIALWNPFRRQTLVDCHNKETVGKLRDSWRWQIFVLTGCMWPAETQKGAVWERERKRSILGQTRPLFLNPFAGNEHTQLQLENCTFYGCHKQRRLCATTLTFTFRSRHRDVGDVVVLCKIRNASFFFRHFLFSAAGNCIWSVTETKFEPETLFTTAVRCRSLTEEFYFHSGRGGMSRR